MHAAKIYKANGFVCSLTICEDRLLVPDRDEHKVVSIRLFSAVTYDLTPENIRDVRTYKCGMPVWQAAATDGFVLGLCRDFTVKKFAAGSRQLLMTIKVTPAAKEAKNPYAFKVAGPRFYVGYLNSGEIATYSLQDGKRQLEKGFAGHKGSVNGFCLDRDFPTSPRKDGPYSLAAEQADFFREQKNTKLMATAHAATVATVATASAALGVLLGLALASLSRTRRKRHAPLVFEGCAEHRLRSEAGAASAGLKYKLQVSLPHTYGEDPSRRYPAIFALDGEPYLFPLLATVARTQHFFCRSTWYPDFIIVGITADLEEDFTSESVDVRTLWSDLRATRARDYLPTQAESPWGYPGAGSLLEVSGHATTFVNFLVSRLVPFVDNVYRTSAERALIGKSLGGSGVAHALLESRDVFQYFLLGSPSLAWDEGAFFRLEESRGLRFQFDSNMLEFQKETEAWVF
ncbi:unnamed protein product [Effrenium voratum]|uniref:Uncharacterized protein n=1 Tax=Effrenium voratum TaxID=2562239 RepID=A0AA36INH7_9DINO|nr:unnamed protein product [Effrenium voratum]